MLSQKEMRYSNDAIEGIWSEEGVVASRIRIEHEWLTNLYYLRIVDEPPPYTEKDLSSIFERSKEIEKTTNHDLASLVVAIEEVLISKGYKDHRMVHFGLTSSDICDTSLSIAYKDSFGIVSFELNKLIASLFESCKDIKVAARTHGANTGIEFTLNHRLVGLGDELLDVAKWIRKLEYFGKLSGPVGLGDSFKDHKTCELATLSRLGLERHSGSTQVIPRHIYADYHLKMAILGKILSRIANSIRLSILAGDI